MKETLGILSCALLVCATCQAVVRAAETSAEENAIRQSADTFTEAFDHGNAKAVAEQWTPDGEYTIGRESVKGREAIASLYGEYFRAHAGSKMKVNIESIRVLAPTVAIEQGTASVSGSANQPPTASAYTAVHVKQAGQWLMASVRESEVPAVVAGGDLSELAWLVGAWAAWGDATKVEMNYAWMANKHFLRGETTISSDGESKSGGTQIIGKDPQTGRIVSWFFNVDGGHGYGKWAQEGGRWIINTQGTSADGAPTSATNVLYHADDNVLSWQSIRRTVGDMRLPDEKEVVIERVSGGKNR